uniref:Uncharacterized protein n=1 Tax=Mimivirus LCMiAC01 TaxID=2506608 RepID=A0A481YZR2_9VIRU|nr:MAG: hypothetical protein LCMiAC01_04240 [Mimivirus LCMiAC01]
MIKTVGKGKKVRRRRRKKAKRVNGEVILSEQEIIEYMNTHICRHHMGFYRARVRGDIHCSIICKQITDLEKTGHVFTSALVDRFIEYINKPHVSYYYSCFYHYSKDIKEVINSMSLTCVFSANHIKALVKFLRNTGNFLMDIIRRQIKQHKIQFTDTSAIDILKLAKTFDFRKMIMENTPITPLLLNYLINNDYKCVTKEMIKDNICVLNADVLCNLCKKLPASEEIIIMIISASKDIKIDNECLKIVCRHCSVEAIRFILDYKIIPNKDIFNALCLNRNKFHTKIEDLIQYGFIPDYTDVAYALNHTLYIPDIERFNIQADKKLLEICWKNNMYPPYKFDCIKPEMIEFEKLCANKYIYLLRQFINKHNIIPDTKCMENACNHVKNLEALKLLVKHGGKITSQCIKNNMSYVNLNSTSSYIINTYIENNNKEINDLKKKIIELEEKVKQSESNNIEINKSILNSRRDNDIDSESKVEYVVKKKEILYITDDMIKKSVKQKRRKKKIPKKYMKCFGLVKPLAINKMTFIELRKDFIDRIVKENLYDNSLINLPPDMRCIINLPKTGYIELANLDRLITLFYN